jgi:hypothetical protein
MHFLYKISFGIAIFSKAFDNASILILCKIGSIEGAKAQFEASRYIITDDTFYGQRMLSKEAIF